MITVNTICVTLYQMKPIDLHRSISLSEANKKSIFQINLLVVQLLMLPVACTDIGLGRHLAAREVK